jgi:glutaredoxin 3
MQTKQLFERLGIDAKVIELDKIKNGLGPAKNSIALKLLELTGQRTVPNVFLLGKHLGGNDQAHDAARSGALKHILFNAL